MSNEPMKIPVNYAEASETLKNVLGREKSPVALKFATSREEIPAGMEELDRTIRHCSMVNLARTEGKIFYAMSGKHECNGGAWALGLREITPTLKTGEFYFKLGKFDSAAACKRTIDKVPHLNPGDTFATLYAPLEKTPFHPQIVLIVANPRTMLKLAQSVLFRLGGRIYAEFSGIQSVCSDATAQTYLTGRPNFSLGCDGSRKYSGILDDEMVMGLPVEMLPEITAALKIVIGAPGSK
jgi:uncharacterized protein (DUF169 family)